MEANEQNEKLLEKLFEINQTLDQILDTAEEEIDIIDKSLNGFNFKSDDEN